MNNPLAGPSGNFKLISSRNREEDERGISDLRSLSTIVPGNPCKFPSKIYVINLEERKDRWEGFKRNNSSLFESFEVQRWNAFSTSHHIPDVEEAIFQSFMSCLNQTLEDQECVILMEDDSYLAEGGLEKLKKAWEDLPEDWDVLIGNHYFFGQIEILTENLAKPIDRASTINFTVFRNTVLSKVESHKSIREQHPSVRDFDHFLTTEMTPINNYTVWPMISREIPSYSNHKGRALDSSTKIREHAHKYKFVDGEKYYSSLEGW